VGRDSSVDIATRYGLDGPGMESRWGGGGQDFCTRPDRPLGQPSHLYKGYRVFPRGTAAGAWRWPPTPFSAEVKERVELYLFTLLLPLPSGLLVCGAALGVSYSRHFEGLHFRVGTVQAKWTPGPWRWRHYYYSKRRQPLTQRQSVSKCWLLRAQWLLHL
jgi:hypothetical protein